MNGLPFMDALSLHDNDYDAYKHVWSLKRQALDLTTALTTREAALKATIAVYETDPLHWKAREQVTAFRELKQKVDRISTQVLNTSWFKSSQSSIDAGTYNLLHAMTTGLLLQAEQLIARFDDGWQSFKEECPVVSCMDIDFANLNLKVKDDESMAAEASNSDVQNNRVSQLADQFALAYRDRDDA